MRDAEGVAQWHELPQGAFLQGVLIRDTDERRTRRVYIASRDVPEDLAAMSQNGQWPHVSEPFADGEITKPSGAGEEDDSDEDESEPPGDDVPDTRVPPEDDPDTPRG